MRPQSGWLILRRTPRNVRNRGRCWSIFFPTQFLGSGFGKISAILPPTYGLDGIRRVLIEGQSFYEVRQPVFMLCLFLGVLLPFSLWVFSRAVQKAKREGSLIQY